LPPGDGPQLVPLERADRPADAPAIEGVQVT
jgi:hypothetical protein